MRACNSRTPFLFFSCAPVWMMTDSILIGTVAMETNHCMYCLTHSDSFNGYFFSGLEKSLKGDQVYNLKLT